MTGPRASSPEERLGARVVCTVDRFDIREALDGDATIGSEEKRNVPDQFDLSFHSLTLVQPIFEAFCSSLRFDISQSVFAFLLRL